MAVERSSPRGPYLCRWAPCVRAHEPGQGQLPCEEYRPPGRICPDAPRSPAPVDIGHESIDSNWRLLPDAPSLKDNLQKKPNGRDHRHPMHLRQPPSRASRWRRVHSPPPGPRLPGVDFCSSVIVVASSIPGGNSPSAPHGESRVSPRRLANKTHARWRETLSGRTN